MSTNKFTALDAKVYERVEKDYQADPKNTILRHALSRQSATDVIYEGQSLTSLQPHYSIHIKTMPVCNQKASGRCWIFAALNLLREHIANQLHLERFELSQSYLSLYDKIEKSNFALETLLSLALEKRNPMEDRLYRFLLSMPVGDGGQWDMFVNLVLKYGLMPQENYRETYQSSNTRDLDFAVNSAIRRFAYLAQKEIEAGRIEEARKLKEDTMEKIMVMFFNASGIPPKTFDFQYENKDHEVVTERNLTPLSFFEKYVGKDFLLSFQSLINSPTADKPFDDTYTIAALGNVIEGKKICHLNLPMERMEELIIAQLKNGMPVWFGSDVSFYRDRASYAWDDKGFDYESAFGFPIDFDKGAMLDYAHSAMNHAMLIVGVDLDENGRPIKWKIENSWGKDNGLDGYYTMSESWFSKFVYQAVIDRSLLSDKELAALKKEPHVLPPWDPMGTLA